MHCELLLCRAISGTPTASNVCLCSLHYELPPQVLTSDSSLPGSMTEVGYESQPQSISFHQVARLQRLLGFILQQNIASEQLVLTLPIWLPEVNTLITSTLPYHRLQQHPQDLSAMGRVPCQHLTFESPA